MDINHINDSNDQWYIISYYINKFICIGLDWVRCLHTADDLFYQQNVKKKMELSSPADRWFLMTGDNRMQHIDLYGIGPLETTDLGSFQFGVCSWIFSVFQGWVQPVQHDIIAGSCPTMKTGLTKFRTCRWLWNISIVGQHFCRVDLQERLICWCLLKWSPTHEFDSKETILNRLCHVFLQH